MPQGMQRQALAGASFCPDRFRHDSKAAPNSSKSADLGEAAKFDRTVRRARNLVNRMRESRIADVGLVGGIEQDQSIVFARIIDPMSQLLGRCHGASWIVRETQIGYVDVLF